MRQPHPPTALPPFRFCLAYVLITALWLLVSDSLLTHLVHEPQLRYRLQVLAIGLWVAATAGLLFSQQRARHQHRRLLDQALDELVGGSPLPPHPDFLQGLAEHLAAVTGHDYVLIGEYQSQDDRVRTLVAHGDGNRPADTDYPLEGTPCERVISQGTYCCPRDARQTFPSFDLLRQLEVESYLGQALVAGDGTILGVIALMDRARLKRPRLASNLLRILAGRATLELERRTSVLHHNASEARFEALVTEASDAILGLDSDLRLQFMNPAAEALFALSSEDVLGQPLSQLLSGHGQEAQLNRLRDLMERAEAPASARMELKGLRPDGSALTAEAGISITPAGGSIRLSLILRDISARTTVPPALPELPTLLSMLFDPLPVPVLLFDPAENRFLYRNPTGQTLFDGSDTPPLQPIYQHPRTRRWYQCLGQDIPWDYAGTARLVLLLDITPLQEDQALNRGLLAHLSHEMRTPLTAILGYAELLQVRDFSREDQIRHLGLIQQEGEKLDGLVAQLEGLRRLSRLALPQDQETVDLAAILRNNPCPQTSPSGRSPLTIAPPQNPAEMQGDALLLRELLRHLGKYAIQSAPDEGMIELSMDSNEETVVLKLCSLNAGFPTDRCLEILSPSYRPSCDRRPDRTELGLLLIRRIIALHQGRIRPVESTAGVACLRMEFPRTLKPE